MNFLAPAAAWMLALLAPLVLLHMLKLKRPPRRVPSLVLWRQTLQDERVNAPLRRLRPDLLFWLQIALLAMLALAAMQPLFGHRALGRAMVIVLDRSASMGARDEASGTTRLDAAKARARSLMAEHGGGDVALVTFASGAELNTPFTSDTRACERALAAVEVEDVGDDLGSALRLVAALGSQRELHRVVLLSDGHLPDVVDFALPFPLTFERLPPPGPNLGITRLAARREGKSEWRIFAAVAASEGATSAAARLRVEVDGETRHEMVVAPTPGAPERVELALQTPNDRPVALALHLQASGFDALASDDSAYLVLPPGRSLRVLLDAELEVFARALAIFDDLDLAASEAPDLVIAHTTPPTDAPMSLTVGAAPAALASVVEVQAQEGHVVDHDRLDPLLTHVELDDLVLLDDAVWRPGQGEVELERAGFTVVVHGAHGPLLVRQRTPLGDRTRYAMLFDPARSTLPYRVAFPVMLSNLLTMAKDAAGLREVVAPRTGNLPVLTAPAQASLALSAPDGTRTTLRAGDDGRVRGARAPHPGLYTIEGDGSTRRLGVSLLDADETELKARSSLRVGDLEVAAHAAPTSISASIWPWIVALALTLACLEWWLYRRARRRLQQ
ncbi:MAG: VWA domain-containing protein [Planctomycetota bacterium]